MTKTVTITAADDSGTFSAFVVLPETNVPAPAVVVIQEIFGVNANMRSVCINLAKAGYIAICPDLFWRLEPDVQLDDRVDADMQRAFGFFQKFNLDKGIEDLMSTLVFIRRDKNCNGKVGTLGYCLGGKLAYLMATRSDADCNVSYYGVDIDTFLGESAAIHKPLLMHIAENDKYVPIETQEKILHALNKNESVEMYVYPDVDHAFARVNGENYNQEAAHQANARTADFLATALVKKPQ